MGYEYLLREAGDRGLIVREKRFESKAKGLCKGNVIGVNKNIETNVEKCCILAEEIGHHYTTVGNILDQSKLDNRKQERRARVWAHERLIPLARFVQAHRDGIRNHHELAEYLGVTEQFLHEAIERYKEKYGKLVQVNDVHLCLEPLGVIELFDF